MKKLKSTWMTLLAVVLSVAMVISGMSFVALAENEPTEPVLPAVGEQTLASDVSLPNRVKYGDKFTVPTGATAKAPNGTPVAAGEVTADQVGSYIVTFAKDGLSYDYNVYCYLEEEYEVFVAHNGADIPTYWKKGDEFTVPAAELGYYDEDGVKHTVDDARINVTIVSANSSVTVTKDEIAQGKKYKAEQLGLVYVRYDLQLAKGDSKHYTKEFTVKVQNEVNDTAKPSISVVNMPTEASVNRKLTLPKATVTDNLDENVKVTVTVTCKGENVKVVEVDENGYAKKIEGAKDVVFDNDKQMSFYPTELDEKYTVTYTAEDDNGNKVEGYSYTITCVDKAAPVFKEIADWNIPETWGLTVKAKTQNEKGEIADNEVTLTGDKALIHFPIPTVVDNSGEKTVAENEGDKTIKVSFTLTNSKGNTVVNFSNIFGSDSDKTYKSKNYTDNKDNDYEAKWENGFKFNPNWAQNTDPKADTYTARYRAEDSKGNSASKSYTIKVENTYTDVAAPTVDEIDAPTYIVADATNKTTFTVPTPSYADDQSTRMHVVYTLNGEAVTGGEIADVVVEGTDTKTVKLVFDDSKEIVVTEGITLTLEVSDSVRLSATTSKKIAVISPKDTATWNTFGWVAEGSDYKPTVKDSVKLNGFSFNVTPNDYPYTGYEISVKNEKGETLNNVSLETYFDYDYTAATPADKGKVVVRNITFTAGKKGLYTVYVRVFNLGGKSQVFTKTLDVAGGSTSGGGSVNTPPSENTEISSVVMPASGSVRTAYKLHNASFDLPEDGIHYIVHKISGGAFSLMGDEFIAYSQGLYLVSDGYATLDGTLGDYHVMESYSISATDTLTPSIEVQGVMPMYWDKKAENSTDADADVKLPIVVAVSEYGQAELSVTVTDPSGTEVTATKDSTDGHYTFEPLKDGAYKVVYKAVLNGGEPVSAEYTVNVGDVIAPEFEVISPLSGSVKLNSTFTFSNIALDTANGDTYANCTFTKKLLDPAKSEVVSVSGKDSRYANMSNNNGSEIKLDKSGTYTVVYEVTDENGNKSTLQYQFTVAAQRSANNVSLTMISTVLIIVGVILIVGVIIYFVRYRKVKPKKEKEQK